jgi:hypothetical protein
MHGTSIEAAKYGKDDSTAHGTTGGGGCESAEDWWALLVRLLQDEQEHEIDRSFDALIGEMERVLSARVTTGSRRAY